MENRASIGRSIVTSHCYGQCVNPDTGEFEDYSEDLRGCYTPERATRQIRKLTQDKTVTINRVEQEKNYYKQDIETFIKHAERY